MTTSSVLVLNQNYEPLNVCNARRAFILVHRGKAEVLEHGRGHLRSPSTVYPLPSVIRLIYLIKRPRPQMRLSRREVFNRDRHTCQYCGRRGQRDHDGGERHTHGGSVRGFVCEMRAIPADGVALIVLSNTDEVHAWEIADNLEVGARDPRAPIEISKRLNTANCDAVVLSACVQMPSLAAIQPVEDRMGLPVLSAAVCTTHQMLKTLGLKAVAPNVGALLSGRY